MRLQLWRYNRAPNPDGDGGRKPLPSLEYAALSRYDVALLKDDSDPENLGDIEAFHDPDVAKDEGCTAALAAMPRLKQDFQQWSSLEPGRRAKVLAAAFAAATLVRNLGTAMTRSRDTHRFWRT